ncbi:MAG: hypothetical protein OHK93_008002 [Ramalina farinacea]|uniref:Uncharacterized protein n=1 Tax=Ramalina farinacea TaxID=258253 RepID=A0AA43QPH8_9LECA|nr:hypothetical protein [Ramalina farinacea]
MPSLKRPNAPQRLPTSAIEGSAFLRIRHESTKAPPSPLPWPTPLPLPPYQTPPLSPTAVANPSRNDPRSQETGSRGARAFINSTPTDYTSLTAHTLRRAPYDTPSPISPGTKFFLQPNSANLDPRKASSPAAIPTSQSPVQQRASHKLVSRGVKSEAVPKPVLEDLGSEGIPTVTALGSIAPGVTSDVVWMAARPKSNESLQSGQTSTRSSRSSLGAKTRKLLNSPKLRISKEVTKDGDPPREARKGFMWQHESSGHWLEIRIGKTGRSGSRSGSTPQDLTPVTELSPVTPPAQRVLSPNPISPPNSRRSPRPDKFAALSGIGQETPSTVVSQPESPSPVRREGLYDRTKRRLGLRRKTANPLSTYHHGNSRTKTTDVLNRTASALRLISLKQHTPPADSTSSSALSMATHPATFPIRQRHNNLSSNLQRHDSTSSSIRSLMMGKPPPGTPAERETYTGSDQQQYFRVELTEPGAPTFLPSEARRINTPPSGKHKGPGFFFDYTAPVDAPPFERRPTTDKYGGSASLFSDDNDNDSDKENDDNDSSSLHPTVKKHNHKKSRRVSVTEWYRVKLNAIDAETPREQTRMAFVEEVPDHLPNSPLCPRNPKHKSGGRGVCAMHGRQEGGTPTEGRTPLPLLLSSIVFGGGRDGMAEVEEQVHRLEY